MNNSYINFIQELKQQIVNSRYQAAKMVNKEQLLLYFNTGKMLSEKVATEKWGESTLQKLADDLQNQLPGLMGFSYGTMRKMRLFYETYASLPICSPVGSKLPSNWPPVATKLEETGDQKIELFFGIGFSHHYVILSSSLSENQRWFYIQESALQGWSKRTLEHHIHADLFGQQGQLPNNFNAIREVSTHPKALEVFQDNYLFDFIQMEESDTERVFEGKLVSQIRDTIMALGKGFCFIGNQHRIELAGEEFFIDLLFFNRILNALVVFELKTGKFKPEHAGQLNFYLNVLDKKEKKAHENPSVGIILCKEKNNTVVEYALRNVDKGMGAATFSTSKKMPDELKGILPDQKELTKLL